MKFCAAVGSAGFPHFTDLNVQLLRHVFGPDLPIVIRDDRSTDSLRVEEIAAKHGCYYRCESTPLGHFTGDVQTFIDALTLGEVEGCDVAIKLSQRAMVAHQDLSPIMEVRFRDPQVAIVMGGRPDARRIRQGHQQYARFPCLTDIVFMRVSAVSPEWFKTAYEDQVRNGKAYHDCFVELFFHNIAQGKFKDQVVLAPELTEQRPGSPGLYLRRYQNTELDYNRLAQRFGIGRQTWELQERANMNRGYDPRPKL